MPRPFPTLAGLVVLLAGPAGAQEQTISPGYWDVTNRVEAVITKTTLELRCITPAQVARFNDGPANRHYTCTYPTRVFEAGRISLKGVCRDKNGRQAEVAALGSYAPDRFQMTADVDASIAGLPVSARFSTLARRIGDACPAGAKTG
jgi:hypothetical protein